MPNEEDRSRTSGTCHKSFSADFDLELNASPKRKKVSSPKIATGI